MGIPDRNTAKHAARGQAVSGIVQLPREDKCAVCPEDIEADGSTAKLVFYQESYGVTVCDYEESSGKEFDCPYVTDTGELNGSLEYCPQTVDLIDCTSS